jgi:hypothetical protein
MASSVGSTIAATIWQSRTLDYMREECPLGTPDKPLRSIYGSISTLKTKYDWGIQSEWELSRLIRERMAPLLSSSPACPHLQRFDAE